MSRYLQIKLLLLFLMTGIGTLPGIFAQSAAPGEIVLKMRATSGLSMPLGKMSVLFNEIPDSLITGVHPVFTPHPRSVARRAVALPEGYYLVRLHASAEFDRVLGILQSRPEVDFAEPNYVWKVDQTGGDPYLDEQTMLNQVQVPAAWSLTTGNPGIPLAVIDTGVDYTHEDLAGQLWINPGEDLNGNGAIDPAEWDGVDNDQNGYIDDLRGWNFTDAPAFPDDGDYLVRDNNPMDEYGHGTDIAGIIAARRGNGLGIAGIAPNCRIMAIRAATKRGYLEEDDVAAAVMYAIENGARVINMSFGDVYYSRLLKDVVDFAVTQNVTIVASAGNGANDAMHYPSGFTSTISVGAVDASNNLAAFSNFGTTMDLVAPGSGLKTPTLRNAYRNFSGTSASTPVVTGIIGLLLSLEPMLTPEEIRTRLTSTATDLGATGVDHTFGAGLVQAGPAMMRLPALVAQLVGQNNMDFDIHGTAAGVDFSGYRLSWAPENTSQDWRLLHADSTQRIIDGVLGRWTNGAETGQSIVIRLEVFDSGGRVVEDRLPWTVPGSVPVILEHRVDRILDGQGEGLLFRFTTSEPTWGRIVAGSTGSTPLKPHESALITEIHQLVLRANDITGSIDYAIEAENSLGTAAAPLPVKTFTPDNLPLLRIDPRMLDIALPSGYLLPDAVDCDRDSLPEVVLNIYNPPFSYGMTGVFEWNTGQFQQAALLSEPGLPRDAGDFDGDGLMEILLGFGNRTFIYEASAADGFPDHKTWEITGFWGAGFENMNGDARQELIGYSDGQWRIILPTGNDAYQLITALPNPSEGLNGNSVPHMVAGDFDGDGQPGLLYIDSDGDLIWHEWTGQSYRSSTVTRLEHEDAVDYLVSGDFDGDGLLEIVAGTHSSIAASAPIDAATRFWEYILFKSPGEDQLAGIDTFYIHGVDRPSDFQSGAGSGDFDGDGRDELFIGAHPDLYIVTYDSLNRRHQMLWQFDGCRTSRFLCLPLPGIGGQCLLFQGTAAMQLRHLDPTVSALPAVTDLQYRILDERSVQLTWRFAEPPAGSFEFHLVRESNSGGQTQTTLPAAMRSFTDTSLTMEHVYRYTLSAHPVQSQALAGSAVSTDSIRTGYSPRLIFAAAGGSPNEVRLILSHPLNSAGIGAHTVSFEPAIRVSSVASLHGGSQLLITTRDSPAPGLYTIVLDSLVSSDAGVRIAETGRRISVSIPEYIPAPQILRVETPERGRVLLYFNQPLNPASAQNSAHYTVEPPLGIQMVQVDEASPNLATVTLAGGHLPAGNYTLTIQAILSADGQPVRRGIGDAVMFTVPELVDDGVILYPNPVLARSGFGELMISNVPAGGTLFIADIHGKVIRSWPPSDLPGSDVQWDLRDDRGHPVGSGVYVYVIRLPDRNIKGKIAVIQ